MTDKGILKSHKNHDKEAKKIVDHIDLEEAWKKQNKIHHASYHSCWHSGWSKGDMGAADVKTWKLFIIHIYTLSSQRLYTNWKEDGLGLVNDQIIALNEARNI